jgi:soluble P-type ATPase
MRNTIITIDLSKDDFVTIYKACEDRKSKLSEIEKSSNNKNEISDGGNDLIEINMVLKELKEKADLQWGESGWTTSDEYI